MPKAATDTLRLTGFAFVISLMMANSFIPPGGRLSRATLPKMEAGTAALPFVRRQMVPQIIKMVESEISSASILRTSARLRGLYAHFWPDSEGGPVTEIICFLIWFASFAIFFRVLEREAGFYGGSSFSSPLAILLLDLGAAAIMWMLFHKFEYSYDPPTLAFSALAMRFLRQERLFQLAVVTALFAFNRETAFIVPGLAFFYWLHRGNWRKAVLASGSLSLVFLAVEGYIVFRFRLNPGQFAENHRAELLQVYTHRRAPTVAIALAVGIVYAWGVFRKWSALDPALKSIQWFVPVWILMHILWGGPMEWRTLLEVVPGTLLTSVVLIHAYVDRAIPEATESALPTNAEEAALMHDNVRKSLSRSTL